MKIQFCIKFYSDSVPKMLMTPPLLIVLTQIAFKNIEQQDIVFLDKSYQICVQCLLVLTLTMLKYFKMNYGDQRVFQLKIKNQNRQNLTYIDGPVLKRLNIKSIRVIYKTLQPHCNYLVGNKLFDSSHPICVQGNYYFLCPTATHVNLSYRKYPTHKKNILQISRSQCSVKLLNLYLE